MNSLLKAIPIKDICNIVLDYADENKFKYDCVMKELNFFNMRLRKMFIDDPFDKFDFYVWRHMRRCIFNLNDPGDLALYDEFIMTNRLIKMHTNLVDVWTDIMGDIRLIREFYQMDVNPKDYFKHQKTFQDDWGGLSFISI